MKKILVTGGCGFIGSHLVRSLVNDGHEVVIIDNLSRGNKLDKDILSNINLVAEDIRDKEVVMRSMKYCDLVYHFAAVLGVDVVADNPVETMETEVIGMKNVVEASLYHGVEKIIYASTSGVYGHSAIIKSTTENVQLDPRTSYAIAKRYNEIYLSAVFEEKGLSSISLRFFNVYGPKQDTRMVIPRFIKQASNNDPITVYGDGKQSRDFTSVEDTIKATKLLSDKISGCEIFNIANETEITILDLAKEIQSLVGSKSQILKIEPPQKRYDFETERRLGSSEKLYKAISYKPNTLLKKGLSCVVSSFFNDACFNQKQK